VLVVRAILGRTLELAGDIDAGSSDLQQAVDMASALVAFDPQNADYQECLALYSTQLGTFRRLTGKATAAKALAGQSVGTFLGLTRQDPLNTNWQRELAEARVEQAQQLRDAGQIDTAKTQLLAAQQALDSALSKHPGDRSTLLAAANAMLLAAALSSDESLASQLRNHALKVAQGAKDGRDDPRLLALQAQALLSLQRNAEAQPIIRKLWESGYRDQAFLQLMQNESISYPVNESFQQKLLVTTGDNVHR
jgi:hypothetical protein